MNYALYLSPDTTTEQTISRAIIIFPDLIDRNTSDFTQCKSSGHQYSVLAKLIASYLPKGTAVIVVDYPAPHTWQYLANFDEFKDNLQRNLTDAMSELCVRGFVVHLNDIDILAHGYGYFAANLAFATNALKVLLGERKCTLNIFAIDPYGLAVMYAAPTNSAALREQEVCRAFINLFIRLDVDAETVETAAIALLSQLHTRFDFQNLHMFVTGEAGDVIKRCHEDYKMLRPCSNPNSMMLEFKNAFFSNNLAAISKRFPKSNATEVTDLDEEDIHSFVCVTMFLLLEMNGKPMLLDDGCLNYPELDIIRRTIYTFLKQNGLVEDVLYTSLLSRSSRPAPTSISRYFTPSYNTVTAALGLAAVVAGVAAAATYYNRPKARLES